MGHSKALYRSEELVAMPLASVAIEQDTLDVSYSDGRLRRIPLDGCHLTMADATFHRRFVRHLTITVPEDQPVDLITPPDEGSIAPRAARLPVAPPESAIVTALTWEIVADWVQSSGRIAGRTVAELARLSSLASPQYAVILGELAAAAAIEMVWEHSGPMRGGNDIRDSLRPLEDAARTSARAEEALVAALAATALLSQRRHRV
jgi:hypothetical protein